MKFNVDIENHFTGAVIRTEAVECDANASESFRLGLATKAAVKAGADLTGADLRDANLRDADFRGAVLAGADLTGADLRDANLRDADLKGADFRGAVLAGVDFRGAVFAGADLRDADLRDARGMAPEWCTPLLMLLEQPGRIRAYKIVNENWEGPFHGGIVYEVGQSFSVDNASIDPLARWGAGIGVATLDWCVKQWLPGFRILIVEFEAADIACIPTATDGEFRLHRCAVVAEKTIDPVALGLVEPQPEEPVADV